MTPEPKKAIDEKGSPLERGRFSPRHRGTICLNCGHALDRSDRYCPSCSQINSTKKLNIKDFGREFLSEIFNYDSKLFRTLSSLVCRPGSITRDFIMGKRLTYSNPFRFLLSLAFIYFLLFTFTTEFSRWDRAGRTFKGEIPGTPFLFDPASNNLEVDSVKLRDQTRSIMSQLDSIPQLDPEARAQLRALDTLRGLSGLTFQNQAQLDSIHFADPAAYFGKLKEKSRINSFAQRINFFYKGIERDTLYTFDQAVARYGIEDRWSNKMAYSWAHGIGRVLEEPGRYVKTTLSKLPLVIFLFLPLFALFIWLAYIRKNHTYTDHLIFSFHNQALLFILLIVSLLLDLLFKTDSTGIFLLIFGVYLYKAMRRFYGQGRFKTLCKFLFLNTVFFVLALFVLIISFTGSIFIYN